MHNFSFLGLVQDLIFYQARFTFSRPFVLNSCGFLIFKSVNNRIDDRLLYQYKDLSFNVPCFMLIVLYRTLQYYIIGKKAKFTFLSRFFWSIILFRNYDMISLKVPSRPSEHAKAGPTATTVNHANRRNDDAIKSGNKVKWGKRVAKFFLAITVPSISLELDVRNLSAFTTIKFVVFRMIDEVTTLRHQTSKCATNM